MNAGSIDAVLTLNATSFDKGLKDASDNVKSFVKSMNNIQHDTNAFRQTIEMLDEQLDNVRASMERFAGLSKGVDSFNKFANGVKSLATSVQTLGNYSDETYLGMSRVESIIRSLQSVVGNSTVEVKGLASALRELRAMENQESATAQRTNSVENERINTLRRLQKELNVVAMGIKEFNAIDSTSDATKRLQSQMKMMESEFKSAQQWMLNFANEGVEAFNRIGQSVSSVVAKTNMLKLPNTFNNPLDTQKSLAQSTALIQQNSQAMRQNGAEILRNMGYRGKLSIEEEKDSVVTDKNTQSKNRNTQSMSRMSTATSGLGRALSSLKMMGTMVGSMFAYNFAHNLLMATNETVHSKSEMEGYFQMLHLTKGQIDDFNKSLEETVKLFPRLNKYSLGETISSVGVEFDLSTEEMKKAMPIVSMITSEYLRAGRNANEASLAVKDILQGEFQRLSRETGVKAEDLKEAGWSGDNTDVMGLLDALDKVGKSRNWDEFVMKANSLNDIILILQNRFSEWSADMVNVVQPTIVGAFNSIMSFAQGLSVSLSGLWKWLNGSSWGATATKIGMVSSAIMILMPLITAWRSGSSFLAMSNLSLTQSLSALIFGINAETLATNTSVSAIGMKLLGLQAEEVAEYGVGKAIASRILGIKLENLTTAEATAVNSTFVGSLYFLITGEKLAEAETLSFSGALAILSGTFLASPIGWFTLAVLGLASAFYVLSGGLSDSWDKMKQFKEAMKDTDSVMQPHTEYLRKLEEEVGATDDKYKRASESVKDFYKNLQSSKAQFDKSELDFENINIKMRAGSDKLFEEGGIPKEKAKEYNATYDYLLLGKDKYYKADQVLNKQIDGENSNYGKNMEEYIQKFGKDSKKFGEYSEKLTGNYQNLAEHSYIANTSDDWWEWLWNSFYAGMDQFWINWDNFWADPNWGDFGKAIHRINVMGQIFEKLGLKPEMVQKAFGDLAKWFSDGFANLGKWFNDGIANWQKGAIDFLKPLDALGDEFNKFMSDPMGYLGIQSHLDNVWKEMVDPLIKGITEDFPNYISESLGRWGEIFDGIKQPLMDAWNNFISFEWLNFDSENTGMKRIDILGLIKGLFSLGDSVDFSFASEFVTTYIITPLSTALNEFMANPLSFIASAFPIVNLLSALVSSDDGTSVWTWVNDNIVTPLSNGILMGIANIPIIGSIAQMLGLVPSENDNAYQTGYNLIDNLKRGVEQKISEIPIISDIARMLGLIPQTEPDAHSKGQGVGSNIKQGLESGIHGIADSVRNEMNNVITAISNKFGEAYATAHDIGSRILNGIKDALDMHSPSIISRELIANEFGVYIPQAISDAGSVAYNTAMEYGQNIKDGISATSFNTVGFDSAVGEYQADAQMVADSSYLMGTTTTTAFNDMTLAVNQTTNTMTGNVATSYSDMQTKQQSSLNSMKTQNLQAYQDMYLKSNQSLIQMRDSTSNVTAQMVSAWSHMKNQLVATANQLKSESSSHFNQLSDTIGSFYRKIQNPSNWGAGAGSNGAMVRGARHPSAGKSFARVMTRGATHHGAGSPSPYSRGGTGRIMTLRSLKNLICPTGNCDIFDGYDLSQKVDVDEFLSSIGGEHGFGWGDWSSRHYSYIKDTSDQWSMKSPTINLAGGIPTNANYKVGDFENGTPKISFGAFQSMAESIFSAIPYRFYYDSNWKGSWLGALQAGACNCSDGADALIAFAQTCGFDGYKQHGTWTNSAGQKFGHFWAVINGKKMDTTGWQYGYGWSPSNSAGGIPVRRATHSPMNVDSSAPSITININEPVYGVDDLDNKIQESVKQGLREEFNDPWTVAI